MKHFVSKKIKHTLLKNKIAVNDFMNDGVENLAEQLVLQYF